MKRPAPPKPPKVKLPPRQGYYFGKDSGYDTARPPTPSLKDTFTGGPRRGRPA